MKFGKGAGKGKKFAKGAFARGAIIMAKKKATKKTAKKASKKRGSKRKPPRGGKPVKAFLVARDNRGRLAGFKKLSMSNELVKDNL